MKKGLRVLSLVMAVVMALMLAVGCSGAKDAKKNITVSVVYEIRRRTISKFPPTKKFWATRFWMKSLFPKKSMIPALLPL